MHGRNSDVHGAESPHGGRTRIPRIGSGSHQRIPRFVLYYFRWLFAASAIAVLLVFIPCVLGLLDAYGLVSLTALESRLMWSVWLYGVCPGVLFLAVLMIWWLRKVRRLVHNADYRLCLRCGYSLGGLPDQHKCPECGIEFDADSLRAQWEHWLNGPWRCRWKAG
jgi:hypothetical protein